MLNWGVAFVVVVAKFKLELLFAPPNTVVFDDVPVITFAAVVTFPKEKPGLSLAGAHVDVPKVKPEPALDDPNVAVVGFTLELKVLPVPTFGVLFCKDIAAVLAVALLIVDIG